MSAAWPTVPLGDVTRLDLNREPIDPSKSYAMVGVLSFARGLFDREPIENGNTSYKYFLRLKPDHIVMSQLFGWEGALALSDDRFAGKYLSPQFPTFLSDERRLDRRFLGWLMRRPGLWADLGTRASGMGDRRRTLNPDAFFACHIPLPPLEEQRRIVARIEELATKVEEARGLRQTNLLQVEALYDSAIARFLPSQCIRTTLGEAIGPHGLKNGKSIKSIPAEDGIRCLTLGALRDGRIDVANSKPIPMDPEEARAYLVERDQVFIVRGNGSKELCGRAGLIADDPTQTIFPDLFIRVSLPRDQIDSKFFVSIWNSSEMRRWIEDEAKTTSGIWKINQGHIESARIPVPALNEQHHIVAQLDALQAKVDAVKALQTDTAAELDAMLPAILDKAFKGEL